MTIGSWAILFANFLEDLSKAVFLRQAITPLSLECFWCVSLRGYSVSHLILEQQQTRIRGHVTEVFQVPAELHRLEHPLRMGSG